MVRTKPLNAYEQSMLLSALLFDNKNVDELLNFIPYEQHEKLTIIKQKFLNLPTSERLTQMVLELRRLLLIDENNYCVHQSWIDDLLKDEPKYLSEIITELLLNPISKAEININLLPISPAYILCTFMGQLSKSPQKVAILDPVLMRLQSLKNQVQEGIFLEWGNKTMSSLFSVTNDNRLKRYLSKRDRSLLVEPCQIKNNPFEIAAFRQHLFREIIRFLPLRQMPGLVFVGLIVTAMYLSVFKYQWRKSIVLVMEKKFGSVLEEIIERARAMVIDTKHHSILSDFLLESFDNYG